MLLVHNFGCDVFLPNVNQNSSVGDIVHIKTCKMTRPAVHTTVHYCYCSL